jgi:hypothetical protein
LDFPESVLIEITGNMVEDVASLLSGGAGPGGPDGADLKNWLLRFGAELESLAGLAEWLANEHRRGPHITRSWPANWSPWTRVQASGQLASTRSLAA